MKKIVFAWILFGSFVILYAMFASKAAATPNYKVEWISRPCITPISNYDYHTCSPLVVMIDEFKITIPKGFITDLASLPRVLWPLLAPQYAGFVYPAILHDFLYRCPDKITRKFADDVFYSALLAEDVSAFTARKLWLGVRMFGASHFSNADNCKYKGYELELEPIKHFHSNLAEYTEVDND